MNQNIPDYKYQFRDFAPLSSRFRKRNMLAFKNLIPEVRYKDLGLFVCNLLLVTIPTTIALYAFPEEIGNAYSQFKHCLENLIH